MVSHRPWSGNNFLALTNNKIRIIIQQTSWNKLVSEVESLLNKVSDWGRLNLVQFNPQKTQVCAFTAKKNPFVVSPQFQGTPLLASASIGILGVDISSDVQFHIYLRFKIEMKIYYPLRTLENSNGKSRY
ncbi:unnamed protein product [Parnassius mnemosyne]|uniref:Uncharacterized protein n=1 Tax=Parnassius mnemosyne TaxID=213953 RepID=A0AAV1MCP7_9NEOP